MRRALRRREVQVLLLVALVIQVVAIAWLVLNPSPAVPSKVVLDLSAWLTAHGVPDAIADDDVVEFVLNIGLFVPTGATLKLLVPRVPWWAWAVVGFVVAGGIELAQWFLFDDRSATWRDVWANTIGFGLGAALAAIAMRVWRKMRERRTRLVVL